MKSLSIHSPQPVLPTMPTLVEISRWRAFHQPQQLIYTFLSDKDGDFTSLTYAELDCKARAIGARLQELDAAGERALLLYPPGIEYIAAFYGCLYAGVVAVPAYPPRLNRSFNRLQSIVENAQPKIILTDTQTLGNISQRFSQEYFPNALTWITSDTLDMHISERWSDPHSTADSLAFLQYSSGSTGNPRGVMVTHTNLLQNIESIRKRTNISAQSRGVFWLPPYHDLGLIAGILQPMYTGSPTILMSPFSFLQRPYRWLQAISQHKGTHSAAPNFAYKLCASKATPEELAGLDLSSWVTMACGAEPIHAETIEQFVKVFAPCGLRREAFFPCYGLAESTLIVTGGKHLSKPVIQSLQSEPLLSDEVVLADTSTVHKKTLVGCGHPVEGQRVLIVHPTTRQRCAPDQIGEIWISGPSIARGYWNCPQETIEAFQAKLADTGEGPFLRTGDLGFFLGDELFVTGRLKDLIILRGHNYYPQDIEQTSEKSHPGLRAGGVAAFSIEVAEEECLVVVQEVDRRYRNANIQEICQAIRQAIALEHEVSVHTVVLIKHGSIAKTSSGKIQRSACRAEFLAGTLNILGQSTPSDLPAYESGEPGEALQHGDLLTLCRDDRYQWLKTYLIRFIAQTQQIDPAQLQAESTNCIVLDSLAAVEIQMHIETQFGVKLALPTLLQTLNVSTLVEEILHSPRLLGKREKASSQEQRQEFPLSYGQRSIWFLHQLAPESTPYNLAYALRIASELDVSAFKRALQALVARHPSLRTTFHKVGGVPFQRVQPTGEADMSLEDASGWSEERLRTTLANQANVPFNLEQGPLFCVRLFQQSSHEFVLLIVMHHIITDFWSQGLLIRELSQFYSFEKLGQIVAFPPLSGHYIDFVQGQLDMLASEEGERHLAYWRQELAGPLPVLDLPFMRSRPPQQTYNGSLQAALLPAALTEKVNALARAYGVSLPTMLMAAFQVLLYRYSGQKDLIVGLPAFGRETAEFKDVAGYFVNLLPIRVDLSTVPTFAAVLAQTRQKLVKALEHQSIPFGYLVERLQPTRDQSIAPIFQATFMYQKIQPLDGQNISAFALKQSWGQARLGDLRISSLAFEQRTSQFDLLLATAEVDDQLGVILEYNTDLFSEQHARQVLRHYQALLENVVESPQERIDRLTWFDSAEWEQVLQTWNTTSQKAPHHMTIVEMIRQQAEKDPEQIAVVEDKRCLNYGELEARACHLASKLRLLGVGPETLVGVCLPRSLELVVGLLAIWKAGGAYVPLDPVYPAERLRFILEDTEATVVLTQSNSLQQLSGYTGQTLLLDTLMTENKSTSVQDAVEKMRESQDEHLAYVIYTSGSTGRPKGVQITHGNVARLLQATQHWFQFTSEDTWTLFHSYAFDFSVWEMWGALATGGRLVIVPYLVSRSPEAYWELVQRERVSVINQTPSAFHQLLQHLEGVSDQEISHRPRLIIFGGEALDNQDIQQWIQRYGEQQPRLVNMYGITETTVHVTYQELSASLVSEGNRSIIGVPIPDLRLYILDQWGQAVSVGCSGELYVGGAGVARGYLRRPELTAERFTPDLFSGQAGERLYRTGDLVCCREDGRLEYLGRVDHQIKLRGFRIEPEEIEALLREEEEVEDAVVILKEDTPGEKRLVGYVVLGRGRMITMSELRERLKQKVPDYMVPANLIVLEYLPLTENGKLDRNALPASDGIRPDLDNEYVEPQTDLERALVRIWTEILGVEHIGIEDDFFALGGHSLLATQLLAHIQDVLQVEISLRALFEDATISGIIRAMESAEDQAFEDDDPPLIPLAREHPYQ